MTTKGTNRKLTMLDLMTVPQGPSEYHIIQGGQLEYAGTDWTRVGTMMAWLRSYRWGEVAVFKNGSLIETLNEPKVKEPPAPTTHPRVTINMIRAAKAVLDTETYPGIKCIKRALEAALEVQYEDH
ncbi:hypothetical protein Phage2-1_00078 [Achromobacter phage 2-1]|nr:hypothetical protein Phage2-1_00078 [Achromobacter phage 2-1]